MTGILICLFWPLVAQAGVAHLDDLWNLLVERLEQTRVAGLHRLEIEGERALLAPALPEGETGELDVVRRSRSGNMIVYRPVTRLRARDSARLASGEAVAGLASGDLLRTAGYRPRLAVRLAAVAGLSDGISRQLESSLAARLEGTGLYRTAKSPEAWPGVLFFREDTAGLKAALERQGADALLNVVVHGSGERLHLLCQMISAAGGDEVFGVDGTLTPELALLFPEGGGRHDSSAARPVVSVPIPSDVLGIAAAQLDGAEGDEIAVLRPRELLIYSVSGESFGLERKVSLADLPAAAYPTRRPVGTLNAADLDGNGRQELLIGSNLWAGGAVVWLDGAQVSFTFIDLQPLQSASLKGRPAFLAGRYRSGEDTFEETVFIVDQSMVAREAGELTDLRTIIGLDPGGERSAVLNAFGEVRVWDRARGSLALPPEGASAAVAVGPAGPGLGSGWLLEAEEGAGGSLLVPVNVLSGERLQSGLLSALDIVALTAYNPPGSQKAAVIVCGLDVYGGMRMAVYNWPW